MGIVKASQEKILDAPLASSAGSQPRWKVASTVLLAAYVLWSSAAVAEDAIRTNSGHTMTAGTFGLAYLGPQGTIRIYDGTAPPKPLPGNRKALAMTAADIRGRGRHELAFLSPQQRSLLYYDFAEEKLSGPYGSNVTDIGAVKFGKDEAFDSIVAGTFVRVSYRWNVEIGDKHWQELPGDLELVATGEFDPRNRIQEVATVTRGELYTFNPKWSTYGQLMIGTDCRLLTAGELTPSAGDEIVVACGREHRLTLLQHGEKAELGRSGVKLAIGKAKAGRVLCLITPAGRIQQYLPAEDKWQEDFGKADMRWNDVLLADLDGDSTDELYALSKDRPGTLFRFDPAAGKFVFLEK
jgi:hypothetical protein